MMASNGHFYMAVNQYKCRSAALFTVLLLCIVYNAASKLLHASCRWPSDTGYAHITLCVHNHVGCRASLQQSTLLQRRMGLTLTQMPQPMHSSSEIHASLLLLVTSMHSLPAHSVCMQTCQCARQHSTS